MDLTRAALLVIDVQRGFDDPSWGPRNNLEAEANIARITVAWRDAGRPVFHIIHDSTSQDSPLRPGQLGNLAKPEAEPRNNESVYRKTVNSAFIGTNLEADLRDANVKTVVLVGLTSNHCVSTTARMAGNLGFATYVVRDATATFDRLGIDGHTRPAEEVHLAALSDLQDEFATVITTSALVSSLREEAQTFAPTMAPN